MPILFTYSGAQMTHTQLPLILANALTIHKVQGQTLQRTFVYLGSQEFSPSLAYVALSRVKTLSSLSIHAVSEERWLKIGSPSTRAQLYSVPCRLKACDLDTHRLLNDDPTHMALQDRALADMRGRLDDALAAMPVPRTAARARCRQDRPPDVA